MPGFSSYTDLQSEVNTVGKRLICPWLKTPTTNPTAGQWYHLWPTGGIPTSGQLYTGTNLDFTRTNSLTVGSLWAGPNVSPDFKSILFSHAMASAGATQPALLLVDQVGYYPLSQVAGAQSFTNGTPPDRYSTAGQSGLQMSLVAAAAGGATASNITTLTYVDQDGNTGATIPTTPSIAVTVSSALPTATLGAQVLTTVSGPFLPLATGDSGVSQVTNITFSAANTGLEALVLVRPLALIPLQTLGAYNERDFATYVNSLERVYDGACLSWIAFFPVATGCNFMGNLEVGWG